MDGKRRKFSAEQKAQILREHFVDRVSVSDLCDRHRLQPTLFYRWQKEALENLPALFVSRREPESRRLREKVERLEAKLAHKDEVIAEIMGDFVAAKKKIGERS